MQLSLQQSLRSKRLPYAIAACTVFFAAVLGYHTYDSDHLVSLSAFWEGKEVQRGVHSSWRAGTIMKTFKDVGPIPDIPPSHPDHIYTPTQPDQVYAFVSDDRPFLDPEDLGLDDPTFLRTRLPALAEGRTIAFYLNMLWTLRHGQRMTRLEARLMPGRHGSWAKHENMAEMARDGSCKWLIYLDTDVYIRQQQYSFHDLRLRWGIHDGILLAAAEDAYAFSGHFNAGFLIMQNKPELQDIIKRWIDCPDKIPECAKFKVEPMHDQAVLNNYIIPELLDAGLMAAIPCNEATGHTHHAASPQPWHGNTPDLCEGSIVTHGWWKGKEHLAQEATQLLAWNLIQVLGDAMDKTWI